MQQPAGHFSNAQLSALRFRIIYDTLSKLSCSINKCRRIEEVFSVLRTDVKYLFDFVAVRLCVRDGDCTDIFVIARNQTIQAAVHEGLRQEVQTFERDADEREMVCFFEKGKNLSEALGETLCRQLDGVLDAAWVFPFKMNGASLVVTILSGPQYAFKRADIPVLKIACESFFSKILSLRLYDEVVESKNSLNEAYALLDARREKIEQLTVRQELVIEERTAELAQKNAKLIELIQFNAHNIREPLTRILGLADLIKIFPADEIQQELLPALLISCTDLDEAIMRTIAYIEEEKKQPQAE